MALALIMTAFLLCGAEAYHTSKEQVNEYQTTWIKAFYQSLDQNSDGWVSMSESLAMFDSFDINKDGILTMREYISTPKGSQMPIDEARRKFIFYDTLDGKRDRTAQRSEIEQFHRMMDTNGDGEATEDEVATFYIKVKGEVEDDICQQQRRTCVDVVTISTNRYAIDVCLAIYALFCIL